MQTVFSRLPGPEADPHLCHYAPSNIRPDNWQIIAPSYLPISCHIIITSCECTIWTKLFLYYINWFGFLILVVIYSITAYNTYHTLLYIQFNSRFQFNWSRRTIWNVPKATFPCEQKLSALVFVFATNEKSYTLLYKHQDLRIFIYLHCVELNYVFI